MNTITLSALIFILGAAFVHASVEPWKFEESFASESDGTQLDKLPGWSRHYGEGSVPLVLTAAGYEGTGVRFSSKANFSRTLETPSILQDRAVQFRIKLRVMADNDAYVMSQVMLGQTGGVSGLYIRFNGGSKDGWEDNFIQVSSGGANWGKTKFQDVTNSRWSKGVWYEIVISDIRPNEAGEGAPVGKVSVRALTDEAESKMLINDVPVGRVGTGSFTQPNVIIIGNAGTARVFDVDDISLKAMP